MLKLSGEKLAVIQKAVRNKLVNHCEAVESKYEAGWFHEYLCEILQNAYEKVKAGQQVRLIIEVPPRHGKSETSTILFPSWVFGQQPDWPVIVSSYSGELAQDFGQATRDLMEGENYKALYNTRLKEDSKAKGRWMTDENGCYTAVGVGGAITGRGFKIGIVDDPHKNRQEADSEVMRENVWKWYKSTFYTRQEGITAIIVIMTRWHIDDLVGRLLEEQRQNEEAGLENIDKWEVVRFPAIADADEQFRKKGEPLWPEKFPIEVLENIKNNQTVLEWQALYQQNPLASELLEFKEDYFRYFEEAELPEKMDIDITIDPAISKKKEACNTAIMAVGKSYTNPNWYLLDYKAGKLNPGELIEGTFVMYSQLKLQYPDATIRVWIEGVAYQESLSYFFTEEMKRRQIYFLLSTFIDSHDKLQRIRGLIPMYKAGVIFHRRWMKELELEAINFPQSKTIDLLDALAFQMQFKINTKDKTEEKPYKTMLEKLEARNRINQRGFLEDTFLN